MFQKHIHKVKFYPSADDFTQALLVMLVTNIMSGCPLPSPADLKELASEVPADQQGHSAAQSDSPLHER